MNNLNDDFFSDYLDEYHYIKDHYDDYGNVPDLESFTDKFPDFDIIKVSESPRYLLDSLYEDRNRRKLATVFNKIKNCLNNDDVDSALSLFNKAADDMVQAKHMNCVDIFQDTSRYDAYADRIADFSKYYVSTGFKELDQIIGGWDREEELATIAARTNQGKSWLALKFAVAAAEQGLTVGIYSGEMTDRKVGYRIDTLISHISNGKIIHGNADIQTDYKKYIDGLSKRFTGTIKVLTPSMIGGSAGVTALRAFIEKENLNMLIVDQHSLLEDDRKAKNPVERAANISKDLKNLQVLKRIPIIAVSQQNRTSTENGVGTEHIAQSDRIAQDSTIVLFFENKDGRMTLNLVKSRDSVNAKTLTYAIDFNTGLFEYMPTEGDGNSSKEDISKMASTYEGYSTGDSIY